MICKTQKTCVIIGNIKLYYYVSGHKKENHVKYGNQFKLERPDCMYVFCAK